LEKPKNPKMNAALTHLAFLIPPWEIRDETMMEISKSKTNIKMAIDMTTLAKYTLTWEMSSKLIQLNRKAFSPTPTKKISPCHKKIGV